jgi:hypothetical protein
MNSSMAKETSDSFITNLSIGRRVEFGGQFGNQLFQIAAVLGQAERMGYAAHFAPWQCEFSGRDYGALYPGLDYREDIRPRNTYRQPDFSYNPLPPLPDCDLRGTFQSPRFFGDTNRLRSLLRMPAPLAAPVDSALAALGEPDFCTVHIRFYDHPTFDLYPMIRALPEYYTLRAIEKTSASLPLLIISDNSHRAALFAQRHLGKRRVLTLPPADDPLVDFYLMTHAAEMVISNSTFAWWAAFLNERAQRVFAPVQRKWLSFIASGSPQWQAPTELYPGHFIEVNF